MRITCTPGPGADTVHKKTVAFGGGRQSKPDAALSYAEHGIRVLPLHTITSGKCSCGKYNCRTPGKHPRYNKHNLANGVDDATTDPETIKFWWNLWPDANIGVTGIEVIDFDAEKGGVKAYEAWKAEHPKLAGTLTARTQGGGYHVYLQVNDVSSYNHDAGEVRSDGYYVVAPPSVGIDGVYEWINAGAEILSASPDDLPDRRSSPVNPVSVSFSEDSERSRLSRWNLSGRIRDLILNPKPAGQRSEADQSVIVALVAAGATDDQIRGIFQHYPIGTRGKYADHTAPDKYLAHSIGKARAYVGVNGRAGTRDLIRAWALTNVARALEEDGQGSRTDIETILALADRADRAMTLDVCFSTYDGAEKINKNDRTSGRSLRRVAEAGSIELVKRSDYFHAPTYRLVTDASMRQLAQDIGKTDAHGFSRPSNQFESMCVSFTDILTEILSDDAFAWGGLGAVAKHVVAALAAAPDKRLNVGELAEFIGATPKTARKHVRELQGLGLVTYYQSGRGMVARLLDSWRKILDEIRVGLPTYMRNKLRKFYHAVKRAGLARAILYHPGRFPKHLQQVLGQVVEARQKWRRKIAELGEELRANEPIGGYRFPTQPATRKHNTRVNELEVEAVKQTAAGYAAYVEYWEREEMRVAA